VLLLTRLAPPESQLAAPELEHEGRQQSQNRDAHPCVPDEVDPLHVAPEEDPDDDPLEPLDPLDEPLELLDPLELREPELLDAKPLELEVPVLASWDPADDPLLDAVPPLDDPVDDPRPDDDPPAPEPDPLEAEASFPPPASSAGPVPGSPQATIAATAAAPAKTMMRLELETERWQGVSTVVLVALRPADGSAN
jgi:hypothetical protein